MGGAAGQRAAGGRRRPRRHARGAPLAGARTPPARPVLTYSCPAVKQGRSGRALCTRAHEWVGELASWLSASQRGLCWHGGSEVADRAPCHHHTALTLFWTGQGVVLCQSVCMRFGHPAEGRERVRRSRSGGGSRGWTGCRSGAPPARCSWRTPCSRRCAGCASVRSSTDACHRAFL